jgi:hypothetical protein
VTPEGRRRRSRIRATHPGPVKAWPAPCATRSSATCHRRAAGVDHAPLSFEQQVFSCVRSPRHQSMGDLPGRRLRQLNPDRRGGRRGSSNRNRSSHPARRSFPTGSSWDPDGPRCTSPTLRGPGWQAVPRGTVKSLRVFSYHLATTPRPVSWSARRLGRETGLGWPRSSPTARPFRDPASPSHPAPGRRRPGSLLMQVG